MRSPMTARRLAAAVAVVVDLPMAAVTVVEEPLLRCALIRAVAMADLVRQRRHPSVRRHRQRQLWWSTSLLNRLLRKLLRRRTCPQAAPVVAVQRPLERAKARLILLISPIGSLESVGLDDSGLSCTRSHECSKTSLAAGS